MNNDEIQKIAAFHCSMEKYLNNPIYGKIELANSFIIIILQIITTITLFRLFQPISPFFICLSLFFSYIVTDFINGLAHMFMDNNTYYQSLVGPFITAFHMHHAKPQYRKRRAWQVYFFESGTKFWLTIYLLCLVILQQSVLLPFLLNLALTSFGIFSSFAEVSHYWCHTASAKNKFILFLQRYRILLSKKHHRTHHRSDNQQYAFLNGLSDPLLDKISSYLYKGYINHADKHTRAFLKNVKPIHYEKL